MYHANFATLGNRSPIINEHIDNSFIIPDYPARSPFCVLSYTICRSFPQIYDFTINQCKILTLCSHSFCMRHQLSLMLQQIYLLNHHCQTSYHTKLFKKRYCFHIDYVLIVMRFYLSFQMPMLVYTLAYRVILLYI